MAKDQLRNIVAETEDVATVEQPPKFEGRTMVMILAPK
jgi:translation initiation factor IF-3